MFRTLRGPNPAMALIATLAACSQVVVVEQDGATTSGGTGGSGGATSTGTGTGASTGTGTGTGTGAGTGTGTSTGTSSETGTGAGTGTSTGTGTGTGTGTWTGTGTGTSTGAGGTGGAAMATGPCKNVAKFQFEVVPVMTSCATSCHAGANAQATASMNLTGLDLHPPSEACAEVRAHISPATPDASEIFVVTDPSVPAVHLFKFGGDKNKHKAFMMSVVPWVLSEQ